MPGLGRDKEESSKPKRGWTFKNHQKNDARKEQEKKKEGGADGAWSSYARKGQGEGQKSGEQENT